MFLKIVDFESYEWIPEIKGLCLDFISDLKKQKYSGNNFLIFNDIFGTTKQPGEIAKDINFCIKKDKKKTIIVDKHRGAACFIKYFLKYKLIERNIPEQLKRMRMNIRTIKPNEYFILRFLEEIFKVLNNNPNGSLVLNENEEQRYINLFSQYADNTNTCDIFHLTITIRTIEKQNFYLVA